MILQLAGKCKRRLSRLVNPRRKYIEYYERLPIDEHAVLLEGSRGRTIDGNIYYCTLELLTNELFKEYRTILVIKNKEQIKTSFDKYGEIAGRITFVIHGSKEYYRAVATCKYLVNDSTFAPFFIKRREQVYLNTWHGTPLKTMGCKNNSEIDVLGNAQHNFCMADYFLAPNTMTERVMTEDYMVDDISSATQLHVGYPRNTAFFSDGNELRSRLGLEGKTVYAYLPTWRGVTSTADQSANKAIESHLSAIDALLSDDEVMLAKLHHLSRTEIDFNKFQHVICFPEAKETYQVLNLADILITDYSSVMFDYAVSGRPIVMFVYDKEEYEKNRGFNINPEELPFEKAETAEELVSLLRRARVTEGQKEFVNSFCPWDAPDATTQLMKQLIFGESNIEAVPTFFNGKKNILLYNGSLESGKAVNQIKHYLEDKDLLEANWYIAFYTMKSKESIEVLRDLINSCEGIRYLEFRGRRNDCRNRKSGLVHEYERLLGYMKFDTIITLESSDGRLEELLEEANISYEGAE